MWNLRELEEMLKPIDEEKTGANIFADMNNEKMKVEVKIWLIKFDRSSQ